MAPSRERSEHPPHGPSGAAPGARAGLGDPTWSYVVVCMHCDAVVFVELPSGWRFWVPATSEAARVLCRGPLGGPRPRPSHGICRACLHRHHAELIPEMRALHPRAGY